MKYEESNLVELKRSLNDDMIKEVIAFLNSYLGGTIYVGINDDGSFYNPTQEEKDLNESRIINWIRDEAIYPNCSDFVDIFYNEDQILTIKINPGDKKPYYLKSKGLTSSGVYIRYGRNKSQASQEEISRMLRERDNIAFESLVSHFQELTFNALKTKFESKGLNFGEFKMVTSGFIDPKSNLYTNLAFWFSDQYDVATKMAVYQGLDRSVFRSKKQYDGSLIKQIDNALEYYELCNEIRVIINGKPTREEIPSYNLIAAREAILNCFCHRDYSRKSNIKIEFFDDRCEILSPGGFYDGLTLEKALNGEQSFRNEKLIQLLFKLGYIENYASGLSRIIKEYKKAHLIPIIESSSTAFKVTFPNRNYEALFLDPKKHLEDNTYSHQKHEVDGDKPGFIIKTELTDTIGDTVNNNSVTVSDTVNHNSVTVSDAVTSLNQRDSNIYRIIKLHPGLRYPQLSQYLKITDPTITRESFARRISKLRSFIEFKGSPKTGGYHIIQQPDDKNSK